MIREATDFDIPAIVGMVKDLHAVTRMPLEVEDAVTERTLLNLAASPQGLVLVNESDSGPNGFIAASVGFTAIASPRIGIEHGWWASPEAKGAGLRLLILYERWSREQGCRMIRMSTPPHNERAAQILRKRGFFVSEIAWCKAI